MPISNESPSILYTVTNGVLTPVGSLTVDLQGNLIISSTSSGGGSGVVSFNTRTGAVTLTAADVNSVGAITNSTSGASGSAPANALTGTLTSAQLLAYLTDATGTGANVFANSPALTGTPTVPTAAVGTNTTQAASTAFVNANAATLANANTFTGDVTAPGFQVMTGPVNNLAYWLGDSRVAGVGVSANVPNTQLSVVPGSAYNSTPIPSAGGATDGFGAHFQNSTFGYNTLVANGGVQGTGIQSAIFGYNNASTFNNTVTGTVTAGSLSITSVTPTTGLTGTMGIAGPGIPFGMTCTISSTTLTLVDPTGWSRKPALSGSLSLVLSPLLGITAGSYNGIPNANQSSPSVNTAIYTCAVVSGSNVVNLNAGAWVLETGSGFTSTHFAAGTKVLSCTNTTATLSNNASGNGATEACTYVPLRFAFIATGINDCQTIAINGSCTNGQSTYTFSAGNYVPFIGESISGTGIPASATLGALTVSGTTYTGTIFVSGSPANFTGSTGTVSITYTPNSSAWATQFTSLVSSLTGVGYTVIPITPIRAWSGVDSTNEAFRSAIVATILASAATNVFPVDMASVSPFTSANQQVYSAVDYLHLTLLGNSIAMEYVNSQLMIKYPSLLTPSLACPTNQIHSIPWDNVTPPPGGMVITAPGNNVTIPLTLRPFSGTSTRIIIGPSNDFIQNDASGVYKLGSTNSNFSAITPIGIGNVPVTNSAVSSTVNGSTSGTATVTIISNIAGFRMYRVTLAALLGTATLTWPTAFTGTPDVITTNGLAAAIFTTGPSTTGAVVTGTTTTGNLYVIGF